jgi:hypothetical protein
MPLRSAKQIGIQALHRQRKDSIVTAVGHGITSSCPVGNDSNTHSSVGAG